MKNIITTACIKLMSGDFMLFKKAQIQINLIMDMEPITLGILVLAMMFLATVGMVITTMIIMFFTPNDKIVVMGDFYRKVLSILHLIISTITEALTINSLKRRNSE